LQSIPPTFSYNSLFLQRRTIIGNYFLVESIIRKIFPLICLKKEPTGEKSSRYAKQIDNYFSIESILKNILENNISENI